MGFSWIREVGFSNRTWGNEIRSQGGTRDASSILSIWDLTLNVTFGVNRGRVTYRTIIILQMTNEDIFFKRIKGCYQSQPFACENVSFFRNDSFHHFCWFAHMDNGSGNSVVTGL